jgi:hypothetical protein
MLGLGWPTLQHQKGPEPSSSLHRESAKAAAGEDNHWRSSYRQASGRKRKKPQREERSVSVARRNSHLGHLVTTRTMDPGTAAEDWERRHRRANRGLASTRERRRCHCRKQHQTGIPTHRTRSPGGLGLQSKTEREEHMPRH